MRWKVDEIYDLMYEVIPKSLLANYLDRNQLDRPWTRYKKEEFAEIVCDTANRKQDLSDFITHRRDQKEAYWELRKLYKKNHNTHPPSCEDWVKALKNYHEYGTFSEYHIEKQKYGTVSEYHIEKLKTKFPSNFIGISEKN